MQEVRGLNSGATPPKFGAQTPPIPHLQVEKMRQGSPPSKGAMWDGVRQRPSTQDDEEKKYYLNLCVAECLPVFEFIFLLAAPLLDHLAADPRKVAAAAVGLAESLVPEFENVCNYFLKNVKRECFLTRTPRSPALPQST